ncbi:abscisic-aldehyde oxidase [Silene latifolia]|uniref:abscisic-aldehyde oxidase n=1 Tax=Silene latifolia TaxID=37657 RepID=UPI003D782B72
MECLSNSVMPAQQFVMVVIYAHDSELIALVVADSQKHADIAAETAVVEYDTENLDPPILSVEDAVERSSFFDIPPFICSKPVGNFDEGMAKAEQKILTTEIRLPSQYFFYMETQTALAVPDEDNCLVVYSSVQTPQFLHTTIAGCLGIPEHNVRVITRRVGGGFGGKAYKAFPVTTACALAAHKLGRPVRTYLNRKTDMIRAGGRHPMKITYSVGFKVDGKITALHLDLLINAGIAPDVSAIMPNNFIGALKKYDWGALSFDIKLCKTNHPSKTSMRAPGDIQGSFIAEAIIENVASILSIDVDDVRIRNLHTFDSLGLFYENSYGEPGEYTLPLIWDKLASSSNFYLRREMVESFNRAHKWSKRGISRIPIFQEVRLRATPGKVSILPDGSIVVEVGGIELGQGLWTKVQQVTAFGLGLIQCPGSEMLLNKVRVIQADTLSMIQGGLTAGSTTSESSCEAVRICCGLLVDRLSAVRDRLQGQMQTVNWETLIAQAAMQSVSLSASTYYVPEFTSMKYLNYGAAVSEVEVNLLTGETSILRTDIIYDCGQSLNPAVDLGQIEGSFVQGIGFFLMEEYLSNPEGLVTSDSTWTYKIPTVDTIPKQFNVEVMNSGHHQKRILSSKASGEPPLLLAASVHCAVRAAVKDARKQLASWGGLALDGQESLFQLSVPATMPVVKELCGLNIVEAYLRSSLVS